VGFRLSLALSAPRMRLIESTLHCTAIRPHRAKEFPEGGNGKSSTNCSTDHILKKHNQPIDHQSCGQSTTALGGSEELTGKIKSRGR
jgi:hypothetical protein